jgi:hypothetical protein
MDLLPFFLSQTLDISLFSCPIKILIVALFNEYESLLMKFKEPWSHGLKGWNNFIDYAEFVFGDTPSLKGSVLSPSNSVFNSV